MKTVMHIHTTLDQQRRLSACATGVPVLHVDIFRQDCRMFQGGNDVSTSAPKSLSKACRILMQWTQTNLPRKLDHADITLWMSPAQ